MAKTPEDERRDKNLREFFEENPVPGGGQREFQKTGPDGFDRILGEFAEGGVDGIDAKQAEEQRKWVGGVSKEDTKFRPMKAGESPRDYGDAMQHWHEAGRPDLTQLESEQSSAHIWEQLQDAARFFLKDWEGAVDEAQYHATQPLVVRKSKEALEIISKEGSQPEDLSSVHKKVLNRFEIELDRAALASGSLDIADASDVFRGRGAGASVKELLDEFEAAKAQEKSSAAGRFM
jgi:hypothetical protein